MKHKNIGSSFEDFLKSEGIQEEVNAAAEKAVIDHSLKEQNSTSQNDNA